MNNVHNDEFLNEIKDQLIDNFPKINENLFCNDYLSHFIDIGYTKYLKE